MWMVSFRDLFLNKNPEPLYLALISLIFEGHKIHNTFIFYGLFGGQDVDGPMGYNDYTTYFDDITEALRKNQPTLPKYSKYLVRIGVWTLERRFEEMFVGSNIYSHKVFKED